MSSPSEPAGVIHDIGYRPYSGPRLGEGRVALALFLTGLRNCYGLGRSAKSKVLPFGMLGLIVLPAVILVGIVVQLNLAEQLLPYSRLPITTQLLISVFAAAQAPALVSRDLRFRTITLYLARPLRRSTYVLVRMASLTAAIFLLVLTPVLILYLGGLLGGLPAGRETKSFLATVVGLVVLSALLGCLSALVSAITTRRGMAVAAVIIVLMLGYAVVSAIQGLSTEQPGMESVGDLAGLFSPYTLTNGLQHLWFGSPASTPSVPDGAGMGVVYTLVTALWIGGSIVVMLLRYRKVASA